MKFINFNLNDHVRVKLTDYGREIHKKEWLEIMKSLNLSDKYSYIPPQEDSDGWSEWQMWVLFQTFGKYMGNGFNNPFSINIEIENRNN